MARIIKTNDYDKVEERVDHQIFLSRERLEDLKNCLDDILNNKNDGTDGYVVIQIYENINFSIFLED